MTIENIRVLLMVTVIALASAHIPERMADAMVCVVRAEIARSAAE